MSTKIVTTRGIDAESVGASLAEQLGERSPALVLVFASTKQPLPPMVRELQGRFVDAVVLGSSTAGEFTETEVNSKGTTVAIAIAGAFEVRAGMGKGLSADPETAVRTAIAAFEGTGSDLPHRTALLLLDPLAGTSEEAALWTGALLGEDVALAGGAAGDDLAMRETFVSCGTECSSDAVVVAEIRSAKKLGLGVSHGHHALSDELEVTEADGATVKSIDGRPAWDVWLEHTREAAIAAGIDPDALKDDEVGGYLLRFEAGLANGDALKIRAPLGRGEGASLNFACAVPQGATFRITESTASLQVEASAKAAATAREQVEGTPAGAVVFDCICRHLILGPKFGEAVRAMSKELGEVPLAGFETYGEIALAAGDMSGFHNTTTVVLAFPK